MNVKAEILYGYIQLPVLSTKLGLTSS